ncbi:MAG: competence/damage-inducible protein A [Deltaproteobacteria bacterium]|nr:MAG: competence/damage-inducible protein A [Deltaproteobacteria bacterium]
MYHAGRVLAEIVTVGDELCRGEIVDTNSSWLAENLWDLDITVAWMTSCRDIAADIARALRDAAGRSDVVLVSGGLGPTEDDLTVDVVAQLAGVAPQVHAPSLARMTERFARAGYRLTDNNRRQVRAPAGARVYDNPVGLAPGFEVAIDGTPVICLPGVPRELHAIFDADVRPRLVELREARGESVERIARRIYRVFGMGESHIDAALAGVTAGVAGASIHYQVKYPETLVKVVVRDRDAAAAGERLAALDREVRARLGDKIYGTDGDTLAGVLGRRLRAAGATLATAESCTGGLVGALVTDVPGASDYYVGGVVAYANAIKVSALGVSEETLAEYGAVSRECVVEMAQGARTRFGADYAVAVSGIAGPGGGTPDKPVGLVWLAVAGPGGGAERSFHWPGARDQIRSLAAHAALAMVLRQVAR